MKRVPDPEKIDHAALREFAADALWVARLEEALEEIDAAQRYFDEIDEGDLGRSTRETFGVTARNYDEDDLDPYPTPLDLAHSLLSVDFENADRILESRLTEWLLADPEHRSIFNLVILQPWLTPKRRWRKDTPRWVQALATNTIIAHRDLHLQS